MTPRVREILDWYKGESPGVLTHLAQLLNAGVLSGTGRVSILAPSTQFSKTPEERFALNRNSYDPSYQMELACELGVSAFCATEPSLSLSVPDYAGEVLTVLELNQVSENLEIIEMSSVMAALSLGCVAVRVNLPLANKLDKNYSYLLAKVKEAKSYGLLTIVSGVNLGVDFEDQGQMDNITYFAHQVSQAGVDIVNVSFPENTFSEKKQEKLFFSHRIKVQKAKDRIKHILDCCFNGKKIVIFSINETLDAEELILQAKDIAQGGGFGTMMTSDLWHKMKLEDARALSARLLEQFKR